MQRKLLALSLVIAMIFAIALPTGTVFAEEVTGTVPSEGMTDAAPVTVNWSRSNEITAFINPQDVYNDLEKANNDLADQGAEARLIPIDRNAANPYDGNFTWEFLNGLSASESENVWDAQEGRTKYYDGCLNGAKSGGEDGFGNNLYNDVPFEDRYTSYHAATWMHAISRGNEGWGVPSVRRFQGTFDVLDAIPAGQELTNIYIGVDMTNPYGDLLMNDGMFVFVYPQGATINEDNYMDFLAYWATTPVNSATEFNGVAKLGTAYGYNVGSGDPDYDFVDGWHINVEEIPAWDVGAYNDETEWVIDIFAIEVDRGGGMAAPSVFVNWQGGYETFIQITKMIASDDEYVLDGFVFDVFPAEGPYDVPLATMTTNEDGEAEITCAGLTIGGNYIVRERVPEGFQPVDDLKFTVDATGENVIFENDNNIIINVPEVKYGSLTISKAGNNPGKSYGSVTATNDAKKPLVVANSNHFTYAKLNKADLEAGVTLDMVVGNKIDKVGTVFVQLVDGKITASINDLYSNGTFHIAAFNGFIPTMKNGNLHSGNFIGKMSNNQSASLFNLNSFQSSDKKGANYDKDWSGIIPKATDEFIYLYIHGDFTFYEGGFASKLNGQTFEFLVKGVNGDGSFEKTVEVPAGGSYKFDNLAAGVYTIKEINADGWVPTYSVGNDEQVGGVFSVEVIGDTHIIVNVVNNEGEEGYETFIQITKMVQGKEGLYLGEDFVFDVFPAEGPYEEPLATLTTDDKGEAEFTWDEGLTIGGNYIVRERVPEGFQAVDDLKFTVDENGVAIFENDNNIIINVPLGSIKVSDDVLEQYKNEYHKPVYKMVGDDESTIINLDGTPLIGAKNDHFGYIEVGVDSTELAYGNNKTPIEISYETEIIDNELYIYFDGDNYELIGNANLRAIVSNEPIEWTNNTNGQHLLCGVGLENAYTALKLGEVDLSGDAPIYLFVHFADGLWAYDLTEVVGCEFDHEEGPFTRAFTGEVEISVIVYKGEEIVFEGGLGEVDGLVAGDDYKVELYVNGVLYNTIEDIAVEAGGETEVDFGDVVVNVGDPAIEVYCDICQE